MLPLHYTLVGGQGIEPQFTGSKPAVLPLDEPPRPLNLYKGQTHQSLPYKQQVVLVCAVL